ncbi:MAG: carboxypeptidase-like regulatory domain-containing protein, partial [bacterium]|nr:carboxypeptidase-like regulatory domain-containing protein [bacterium]
SDLTFAQIPPITNLINVINGVIYDKQGNFIPNVIIIVKDADKSPVRALKSNRLGQFAISTPLPNGQYAMEFEDNKDEKHFDTYQISLMGNVIPPVEIKEA